MPSSIISTRGFHSIDKGKWYSGLLGINEQKLAQYDLVMVTAAHTNVDYGMVQKNAAAVFDTKNVMKDIPDRENIWVL